MSQAGLLKNKRILIVDNTRAAATILRNMVRRMGAERIDEAESYQHAVPMLEATPYDIVFCDVDLGDGLSGQQLLRDIREFSLLPMTSIFVFVSSEQSRDMVLGSIEHEPDGYVVKPFRIRDLERRTAKFLERNSALCDFLQALENGELDNAKQLGIEATRRSQRLRLVMLNYLARYQFRVGDFEAALQNFVEIRKVHDVHWARLGEAQSLTELGYLAQAEDMFTEVLNEHRYATPAIDGLARVCEIRKDQRGRYRRIKEGSELSPLNVSRLEQVSAISEKLGIWDEAVDSCRRIYKLTQGSWKDSPEYRNRYFRVARKWIESKPRDKDAAQALDKAFHEAKQSVREYPDHDGVRFNYALLTASKNNKDNGAIYSNEILESIVDHYPEYLDSNETALEDLQKAFKASKDKARSEVIPGQVREKALKAKKARLAQCSKAASKAYRKGDLATALDNFERMLDDDKHSITLNLNIAHIICMMVDENPQGSKAYKHTLPYLMAASHISREHKDYPRYAALKRTIINGLKQEKGGEKILGTLLRRSA